MTQCVRLSEKHVESCARETVGRRCSRGELSVVPAIEVSLLLCDHENRHRRMLVRAVLRARNAVRGRGVSLEPRPVCLPGKHVSFPGERWCPERMNRVAGAKLELNHP